MDIPNHKELRFMLRENLSSRRVLHTLGVEAVAACMAMRWGADAGSAKNAALLHDSTKEEPDQLILMRRYGILPSVWEETVPDVYHTLTGAARAQKLGFCEDVVSAVRWHATGRARMTLLEKILFLADMAEPCRAEHEGLRELHGLLYVDIDRALALGLRITLSVIRKNGRPEDRHTGEALRWLEGKIEDEIL